VTLPADEPSGQQPTGAQAPWAKQRILETANELFYNEGIRIVGVDRLITVSSVTKATFYKHYLSKDRLILSYLAARRLADREQLTGIIATSSGAEAALQELVAVHTATIISPSFRGCAFTNASAEFSDPLHPVRQLVAEHREWKTEVLTGLFSDLGHAHPAEAADGFLLTIDGAHVGGYTGDPVAATNALHQLTESIIAGSATA
jgi:AcrR family transcriptional regulator